MEISEDILKNLIKILSIVFGAILLFFIGLMIGYGVIGDGSPFHVFNRELWQHILDFFNI
ncbi:MAG TPA: DNA-directed RNA polymerase subunit beta [Enterococcus sp.]|nr:DNA-directed RNA polymerase subunit beta [Enterococcus sp.]HPR80721.1 DNA-directed RNA polymerase subunit beta [Enterococcus sp.]